jgi:hypothetical protein
MTNVPTTFDEIDRPGRAASTGAFELICDELGAQKATPCWETSLLQWFLGELAGRPLSLLGGQGDRTIEPLRRVSDKLIGAAASLLPAEIFINPPPAAVIELRERLLAQHESWPALAMGGGAFAICADHLVPTRPPRSKSDERRQYRLPARLYPDSKSGVPADWKEFNRLVSDLVRSVCAKPMQPTWFEPSHETAIPTILHELFKNTHDHARSWWDGTKPKFSLRGVSCNYYPLEQFEYLVQQNSPVVIDPASAYIRELMDLAKGKSTKAIQSATIKGFLELSIFDSGPGLVGRAIGADPSTLSSREQLDVVRECLRKGYSSTDNETRGYGLSKVLSRLRRAGGFIRIRSNGVSGYRSFARFSELGARGSSEAESASDRLLDWRTLYSPKQTAYINLRGTVVTVLIPMGDADGQDTNP